MSSESSMRMRASDVDRDRAAEILGKAYAAGRLTHEEFLERAGAACSAKTWGELRQLSSDLPEGRALVLGGAAVRPGYQTARSYQTLPRSRTPLRVMALIWLAIAGAVHVAAALPLLLLALVVLAATRTT